MWLSGGTPLYMYVHVCVQGVHCRVNECHVRSIIPMVHVYCLWSCMYCTCIIQVHVHTCIYVHVHVHIYMYMYVQIQIYNACVHVLIETCAIHSLF